MRRSPRGGPPAPPSPGRARPGAPAGPPSRRPPVARLGRSDRDDAGQATRHAAGPATGDRVVPCSWRKTPQPGPMPLADDRYRMRRTHVSLIGRGTRPRPPAPGGSRAPRMAHIPDLGNLLVPLPVRTGGTTEGGDRGCDL